MSLAFFLPDKSGDVAMSHPLPADVQAQNDRRRNQKELIAQMEELGCLEADIKAQKDALAKMPREAEEEVQQLKVLSKSAQMRLTITQNHAKLEAECDRKEETFAEEEVARNLELKRELKAADEEHQLRLAAIQEQHKMHSEPAKKKREENPARKQNLKERFDLRMQEMQACARDTAVTKTLGEEQVKPVPMQSVPVRTTVATSQQVTADDVIEKMAAEQELKSMPLAMGAALAACMMKYLNSNAFVAEVAPLGGSLEAGTVLGDAAPAIVL